MWIRRPLVQSSMSTSTSPSCHQPTRNGKSPHQTYNSGTDAITTMTKLNYNLNRSNKARDMSTLNSTANRNGAFTGGRGVEVFASKTPGMSSLGCRSRFLFIPPLLLLLAMGVHRVDSGAACRISEFPCRNAKCVRLNSFCDGQNDCGDLSDEPPFCSVCNKTYYGDVGKTYDLKVHKSDSRLPFLCHLTFTANGQMHGDIVQKISPDHLQCERGRGWQEKRP